MNTNKYITGVLLIGLLFMIGCSKLDWWNGNNGTLTNQNLPFVSSSVDSTSDTSITATITIKDGGNPVVFSQGVCWGTSPNPTVISNDTIPDTTKNTTFTIAIKGLKQKTTYYLRGYARNSKGVGYSTQITITTPAHSQYRFGDTLGGGIIFYIDTTGLHGLVCDTANLFYKSPPDSLGNFTRVDSFPWSVSNRNNIYLNNGTAIGTEASNTLSILVTFDSLNSPGYDTLNLPNIAASICRSSHNKDTSWYLPSIDALNLMYKNLAARGFGNFTAGNYWSSSDYLYNGRVYAWAQYFGNGNQYYFNQSLPLYVRAVKRF